MYLPSLTASTPCPHTLIFIIASPHHHMRINTCPTRRTEDEGVTPCSPQRAGQSKMSRAYSTWHPGPCRRHRSGHRYGPRQQAPRRGGGGQALRSSAASRSRLEPHWVAPPLPAHSRAHEVLIAEVYQAAVQTDKHVRLASYRQLSESAGISWQHPFTSCYADLSS